MSDNKDNASPDNAWQARMKNLSDAQRQLFENMQAMAGLSPQHSSTQQSDTQPEQQTQPEPKTAQQPQNEPQNEPQSNTAQTPQDMWHNWQEKMKEQAASFAGTTGANPANPMAGAMGASQWQAGPIPETPFTTEQFQAFAGAGHPPGQPPTATLVKLKENGTLLPFFCVHAMLGSAFPYHQLALNLPDDQPCYGLQSRGLDGVLEPLDKIEEMASLYVSLIKQVQPKGPYYIGGYSFGGWIAFEMARLLKEAGDKVALLALFETSVPFANPLGLNNTDSMMQYQKDYMSLMLNSLMSEEQRVQAESQMNFEQGKTPMQKVIEANFKAQLAYAPRPADTAIELFITKDVNTLFASDPTMGWKWMCTQEVNVREIEGNHISMFQPPHVVILAAKLNEALQRSRV